MEFQQPAPTPFGPEIPVHQAPVSAPGTDAAPASDAAHRGRNTRTIIAACLLSAVLASASTTALVSLGDQSTSNSAGSAGATPNALVVSEGSSLDLADIVAAARRSVVTITANGMTTRGLSPFSVPTTGVGSGIILTSDGYILTNRHVVEGSDRLTVTLHDGTELSASVVKQATDNDLALIKVDATGLAAATIGDSSSIRVGDTAIAIGSPLGTYTETVTKGIISATGRSITVADELTGRPTELHDLLQTDAAINPGNSGGPVIDATGAVVGMATAVADSAEGLGFAIPINAATELIALAKGPSAG